MNGACLIANLAVCADVQVRYFMAVLYDHSCIYDSVFVQY